jgi:hypothetical protein
MRHGGFRHRMRKGSRIIIRGAGKFRRTVYRGEVVIEFVAKGSTTIEERSKRRRKQ